MTDYTSLPRPFRLRVLDALTDVLKTITPGNGYVHDLSQAVFRGRSIYGENDPLPMVSILETPIDIEQIISPEFSVDSTGDWDLLIQGFVEDDPENPTDPAHFLMADVKKALIRERKRRNNGDINILNMGGLVDKLNVGAGSVRPSDEISSVAYFWVRITLRLVEDLENPY